MLSRRTRCRVVPAVIALTLALAACVVRYHSTSHYRPVAYDHIVRAYFPQAPAATQFDCEVDIWGLWKELGINPRTLRARKFYYWSSVWQTLRRDPWSLLPPAPNIFQAKPGVKTGYIHYDLASLEKTKVIALAREHGRTQVLVFRGSGKAGDDTFRFAYQFVESIDGASDRPGATLLNPQPGVELLSLSYRNAYGTGILGWGWSLYRLDARSAGRLLKTDTDGYEMDYRTYCGYGYRCEITDLSRTWPRLGMDFYAERVPDTTLVRDLTQDDLVDVYELKADITLTWDARSRTFRPAKGSALSDPQIGALIASPVGFLRERSSEAALATCPPGVIVKKKVRESDCLAGWGK